MLVFWEQPLEELLLPSSRRSSADWGIFLCDLISSWGSHRRDDGDTPASSFCFFPYKFPLIPVSPSTPVGSGHSLSRKI